MGERSPRGMAALRNQGVRFVHPGRSKGFHTRDKVVCVCHEGWEEPVNPMKSANWVGVHHSN